MPERSFPLMMRFTHFVGKIVTVSFLGGAFAAGFVLLLPAISGQVAGVDKSLYGAFFGALLGFVASRFAGVLDRFRQRHVNNHNALLGMQRQLNLVHQLISELRVTLENYSAMMTHAISSPGMVAVFSVWPERLPELKSETLDELINIDFYNDAYSTNQQLRRINLDLANIGHTKDQIQDAAISKRISPGDYVENLKNVFRAVLTLDEFLVSVSAELIECAATARILAHEERPMWAFGLRVNPRYYPRNFQKKLAAEKEAVVRELKECEERSRRQIAEVERKLQEAGVAPPFMPPPK